MKITRDLRDIRDVDRLNTLLTMGYSDAGQRIFKEGVFLINQKILSQIEGFYHYDEQRTPTHKSHEVYKKSYSYFRPGPYLEHYLTGGSESKAIILLQWVPEYEDPILLVKKRSHFTYN